MSHISDTAPKRNQALDILRGIAVLMVLGRHYDYFQFWWKAGWAGVDLFFTLSGFLIGGLLFTEYKRKHCVNVKRFWVRRGFKIYPPFYFMLLLTAMAPWAHWRELAREAAFIQNFIPSVWAHTWSLAVEEHFYVLLPVVLLLMMRLAGNSRDPFKAVPFVSVALSLLCLGLRGGALSGMLDGRMAEALSGRTYFRMDELFTGVALAYYFHFHREQFDRASRWILPGLIAALPVLASGNEAFTRTLGCSLLPLGFGCLLIWSMGRKPSNSFIAKAVSGVGYYSYSIYLWHGFLAFCVFNRMPSSLLHFVLYLIASVAVGMLAGNLIEKPALILRERIGKGKSEACSQPSSFSASSIPDLAASNAAPESLSRSGPEYASV